MRRVSRPAIHSTVANTWSHTVLVLQQHQRVRCGPARERREPRPGHGQETVDYPDLLGPPEQRAQAQKVGDPHAGRDPVGPDVAAAHGPVLDLERPIGPRFESRRPLAHLLEAVQQLVAGRSLDREHDRLPMVAAGVRRQIPTGIPALAEDGDQIDRLGPAGALHADRAVPGQYGHVLVPAPLVLRDGERLQPRVAAGQVVDEANGGHVRLDHMDLLQWRDDQKLQAEPGEERQRVLGRHLRPTPERLVDDHEAERLRSGRPPVQFELVGQRGGQDRVRQLLLLAPGLSGRVGVVLVLGRRLRATAPTPRRGTTAGRRSPGGSSCGRCR